MKKIILFLLLCNSFFAYSKTVHKPETITITAQFTSNTQSGYAPLSVSFTDQSTISMGFIATWTWTFGDGSGATTQNTSHTYLSPGTYTVRLIVTGMGVKDTMTKTSYISVTFPIITAKFSAAPVIGTAPLLVYFYDSSTIDHGTISAWKWYFGDGDSSSTHNPTHTYTHAGVYDVVLKSSGSSAVDTSMRSSYITVEEPYDSLIVYDSIGQPMYMEKQLIVKFMPELMLKSAVDDTLFQSGKLYQFVDSTVLAGIIENSYYNVDFANLHASKIFRRLTTKVTYSIDRMGDTIPMPKLWSALLITWPSDAAVPLLVARDSLNKLWPYIEYAHLNYMAIACSGPNDTNYVPKQKSLNSTQFPDGHINIEPAWAIETGKSFVKVGIFDTGLEYRHEDFGNGTDTGSVVKGGYDYFGKQNLFGMVSPDAYGHGTRCAGIIGARRNNITGIAGIAGDDSIIGSKGVSMYGFKMLDDAGGANSKGDMAKIVDAYTEGTSQNFTQKYGFGMDILNSSWGFYTSDIKLGDLKLFRDVTRLVFENKTVHVVARGNSANTEEHFPATFYDNWVLSVGGGGWNGNMAKFDNMDTNGLIPSFGKNVDLVAPSSPDMIWTTSNAVSGYGKYIDFRATSAATPHVAGVAALMLSYLNQTTPHFQNLAGEDVENILQMFATDKSTPGYDDSTGWGLLNAGKVMEHIVKPKYQIQHEYYDLEHIAFTNKVASNVSLHFQDIMGIPSADYVCDVFKEEFTYTFPSGSRKLLAAWPLYSASNCIDYLGTGYNVAQEVSGSFTFDKTAQSITYGSYRYLIKQQIGGSVALNWWFPKGPGEKTRMAWSEYSDDTLLSGVNEVNKEKVLFNIYPNPNNGSFELQFATSSHQLVSFNIYSSDGRIAYQAKPLKYVEGRHQFSVDMNNFAQGVYICEMKTEKGVTTRKFIVAK